MVFFTCNHCGDSLQKPKVEKHISLECKKKFLNPSLTCVDCLGDFNRKSYVEHTKCVTEEERYSAKGFVPKSSANKGEKKQKSWIEVVRVVLENSKLTEAQKKLLKIISNYENVPRKLAKFQNFIRSSCPHLKVDAQTSESVFKLLDTEFKSITSNATENKGNVNGSTNGKPVAEVQNGHAEEDVKQNGDSSGANDDGEFVTVTKKKKKRNKTNAEEGNVAVDSQKRKLDDDENDAEEIPKKHKKHKKNKSKDDAETDPVDVEDSVAVTNTEEVATKLNADESTEAIPNKKNKKRKNKSKDSVVSEVVEEEQDSLNVTSTEETATKLNDDENIEETPNKKNKKRKNKSKDSVVSEVVEEEQDSLNVASTEEIPNSEHLENLTKKERKERKKKLKYEAELKAIEREGLQQKTDLVEAENTEEHASKKKEKKKKRKLEECENNEVVQKKVRFSESIVENKETENNLNASCTTFSWEEVIKTILEKSNNQEISVERLCKRTVNEYQLCCQTHKTHEELVKKFNKKVAKLPFVKIFKGKAKLSIGAEA